MTSIANQLKKKLIIKEEIKKHFERLKKYLITDLHYDKEIKDEPNLYDLFNYMTYIRNKTRGHGTPSKVEFEFYATLDLISIFIVNCISKIEIETFSRQLINQKEWLLYYNAGGNVILHPLDPNENLEYWEDSPRTRSERSVHTMRSCQMLLIKVSRRELRRSAVETTRKH